MEFLINHPEDLTQALAGTKPIPADRKLGEMLLETGHIQPAQLELALGQQQRDPRKHLGEILVELGHATPAQVNAVLASKLGIPSVRLGDYIIPPDVLDLLPRELALQYGVLPLAELGQHLVVAMENPFDWQTMEMLRFNTNHIIEAVVISRAELERILGRYHREQEEEELKGASAELELQTGPYQDEVATALAQEAQRRPTVRLVNAIISQGIARGASDINIRPERGRVAIYYRIDGHERFSRALHRSLLAPIVSRLKILGRMDIAERRLPQDGHARVVRDGNPVDLRLSIIPTVSGESVVIRVLDRRAGLRKAEELGLGPWEYETLTALLSHNQGILLVTGPTGSGKSTTLYALLNEVQRREAHIITVEDPVEYDMEGIEQIQIAPATGYTFAEALRHILRHDPDVIMVGEIRDFETAQIANRAALTGHLVMSTLHTNDAASTVTRLLDMGIEPYLLGSTLLGVMAQRLIRVNCPHCIAEDLPDPRVRKILQLGKEEVFYRGRGCEECEGSGYHGRVAVTELLEVTPRIASLINNGASATAIQEEARRQGMTPLNEHAVALARTGKTSLEEVTAIRVK